MEGQLPKTEDVRACLYRDAVRLYVEEGKKRNFNIKYNLIVNPKTNLLQVASLNTQITHLIQSIPLK
jgi:hypothetical protein